MGYDEIRYLTLLIYKRCGIKAFPFNCLGLLEQLNTDCIKYSSLSTEKREICFKCSDSAFMLDYNIYYNDAESAQRIRFSLMHELGHIMLGHKEHTNANEQEANFFAKNMLAPPMAINYSHTIDVKDIATLFNITPAFSSNAIKYYKKWHDVTIKYGMNKIDRDFYYHFYDEEFNGFVFNKRYCSFCGEPIYNKIEPICKTCESDFIFNNPQNAKSFDESMSLRNNWLYGGI